MKTIVFGASGYLGRHIVADLISQGHEVNIPLTQNGNRIDLTKPKSLIEIDWDVDVIYMFAGITGTITSFDQFDTFLLSNELSLLNVLNSIRLSSTRPRIVFPSSRLIYRGSEKPLLEGDLQESNTLYSANKIACEHFLNAYSKAFDIPYTIFRVCVPYANLLDEHYSFGTVGNLISQAKNDGRICLYGGGLVRRTFTHIQDLTEIILRASLHPATVNQIYNIPGEDLSLYEAACMIAKRTEGVSIESIDWPEFDFRIESGSTVFDGKKLSDTLELPTLHRFKDWIANIS